jgi:predicted RNA methylase
LQATTKKIARYGLLYDEQIQFKLKMQSQYSWHSWRIKDFIPDVHARIEAAQIHHACILAK